MEIRRRSYLGAIAAGALGGCVGRGGEPTLTVGVVPDVDPDTAVEQNTELANYLEEELDVSIDLQTSANYAGMVRAMVSEEVDLAYYGGVSYILAHHRAGAEPVVVGSSDGKTQWHSAFIVPEQSSVQTMEDVQSAAGDLDVVFGDPISTSGTVMPTYYLKTEHDLTPEADFEQVTHVGAHDATAKTISSETGALGALNARIYDALVEANDVTGVREVWRTPGFPDYPWAVAPSIDGTTTDEIRAAFTGLNPENNAAILDQQNVDGYVEVTHDDFASLDTAVNMAGIEVENGSE
ncbi:MAG: phosphate/phosphite/phosphonate ABC transporter substrate-binding protein [Haloarcula sp.]